MADNLTTPVVDGTSVASKDIGGVQYPKNIITDGSGVEVDLATSADVETVAELVETVGTRSYGATTRVGIGLSSAQSSAIVATEVLVHAKGGACYIVTGANPTATVAAGIPIENGEKFHLRIVSGEKIANIGDVAAGYLYITPVA